jgi:hypothetical protein
MSFGRQFGRLNLIEISIFIHLLLLQLFNPGLQFVEDDGLILQAADDGHHQ